MSEVFSIVLFYTYFSLVAMRKLQRNISLNCKGFYVWLCYGRYFLQERITTNWSLRKVIAFIYEEWRSLILSLVTSTKAWPYKMSSCTIFSANWTDIMLPYHLLFDVSSPQLGCYNKVITFVYEEWKPVIFHLHRNRGIAI